MAGLNSTRWLGHLTLVTLSNCFWRVYASLGKTLEVFFVNRLHCCRCRSHAAELDPMRKQVEA
jgi:hypothetical protein